MGAAAPSPASISGAFLTPRNLHDSRSRCEPHTRCRPRRMHPAAHACMHACMHHRHNHSLTAATLWLLHTLRMRPRPCPCHHPACMLGSAPTPRQQHSMSSGRVRMQAPLHRQNNSSHRVTWPSYTVGDAWHPPAASVQQMKSPDSPPPCRRSPVRHSTGSTQHGVFVQLRYCTRRP